MTQHNLKRTVSSSLPLHPKTDMLKMAQWETASKMGLYMPLYVVYGTPALAYRQPTTAEVAEREILWHAPVNQTCLSHNEMATQTDSATLQNTGFDDTAPRNRESQDDVKKPTFDEILKKAMDNVSDQLMALLEAELDRMEDEGEDVTQDDEHSFNHT